MKAISINQPWAWLIANGHKDIENRDWQCSFRGDVFIHAGKKIDEKAYDYVFKHFPDIWKKMPAQQDLPRGGIVGQAKIIGCVESSNSPWFIGKYGFVLIGQKPLELKSCKGALGFFKPDYNSRYKGDA